MIQIQAPDDTVLDNFVTVFLAGGITSCHNWQMETIELFSKIWPKNNLAIFNPRRKVWDDTINNKEQIEWEFHRIKKTDIVAFWFPPETLCPITLFEYGKFLGQASKHSSVFDQMLVVGCHPDYKRKEDVIIQTKLERPDKVAESFEEFNARLLEVIISKTN